MFTLFVLVRQDVETGEYMVAQSGVESQVLLYCYPWHHFNYTIEFGHSVIAAAISSVSVCVRMQM